MMKVLRTLGFFGAALVAVLFVAAFTETHAQRSRQGSMEWSGTVDDRVNLIIRGRNVRVETLSGRRYGNGRYDFDREREDRRRDGDWDGRNDGRRWDRSRANVERMDGRGNVRIIQQPNRRNNYTTIVQIRDEKGGPDRYRIRVDWE
jgi:hypothetical protein